MNPMKQLILLASLSGALLAGAADEPAAAAPPAAEKPVATEQESPPATPSKAEPSVPPALAVISETDKGLRFNFRGVPLEMVLNYLSDAAGFVIVSEAEVKGKVDVFSNQPLNKEEAVSLLNTILNKNGLAALRNGRTLTIIGNEDAKKKDLPVKSGSEPDDIPKTDDMVTQILPVRSLNAAQLAKDLQPLIPSQATLTPNEAGNSLVMTGTQSSIHRIAEIIKALDSSSVSSVRVFALKFADAKSVAAVLKEVFQAEASSSSSSRSSDYRSMFFERMGESFHHHDHGDQSGASGRGGGNSRVVAAADDHSNSVVVSAPDDLMSIIKDLIAEVDTNIEDVTEVRVFRLKYADPVEMSELLGGLFPDDTKTDETRSQGFRFGGGLPFGYSGSSKSSLGTDTASDRMKKKGRVLAVPDRRTASVVVSAAKDMMVQIAGMIEQLDKDPARKQRVFVYSLQNADVQGVEQILHDLFQSSGNSKNNSTANQNNNALMTRQNSAAQTGQTTAGFGTSTGTGMQPLR